MDITTKIKQKALELGFTNVGIATVAPFLEYEKEILTREDYRIWMDREREKYPGRSDLITACHPEIYFPEGKSIICLTFGYGGTIFSEKLSGYLYYTGFSHSFLQCAML